MCNAKEDYINAVKFLLNDKEKAIQMGLAARQDIIDKYNTGVMKNRYVSLFRRLGLVDMEKSGNDVADT